MSMIANGGTALITGASSGIGETFARHLARRQCHLILTARRRDRLETLARELQQQHPVKVEIIAADLATDEGLSLVEDRIAACHDLTCLVNNAGFGSGGAFHLIDLQKQLSMIQVHVVATTRLTRAALPQMVARRQGAVINVASVAAFACIPTSAMYGATKAWMVSFSQSLAEELQDKGVRIQALCPGFTITGFHDTPEYKNFDRTIIPVWMWMTSDQVVSCSLQALEKDRVVCIPGMIYRLLTVWLRLSVGRQITRYFGRKRWRKRD